MAALLANTDRMWANTSYALATLAYIVFALAKNSDPGGSRKARLIRDFGGYSSWSEPFSATVHLPALGDPATCLHPQQHLSAMMAITSAAARMALRRRNAPIVGDF